MKADASPLDDFFISPSPQPPSQAASGMVLLACAALAMAWANSPWSASYDRLWHAVLGPTSPQHIVNDGLMALFFLLVGLEIRHEVVEGALSSWRRAALPVVGAIGGMLLPAALYALAAGGSEAAHGWGVPMATDIAFALGIVALLGERVPPGLRVFLAALAIADDLGAVLVIAVFYTPQLDWMALGGSAALLAATLVLNRMQVRALWPYVLLGLGVWWTVLQSGVHATIAGVAFAMVVPTKGPASIQHRIERILQHPVTFGVLPLFALANAGVALPADVGTVLRDPAAIGVFVGLVVGKPLGIFGAAWGAVRLGMAELPSGATWRSLFGVGLLGGIGFTMSLFIAALAFDSRFLLDGAKLGVLAASLVAGSAGALVLWMGQKRAA